MPDCISVDGTQSRQALGKHGIFSFVFLFAYSLCRPDSTFMIVLGARGLTPLDMDLTGSMLS